MQMKERFVRLARDKFRFAAAMVSFMGVAVLLYRDSVLGAILSPLAVLTAQATLFLLHLSGIEAAQAASQIYHPGGFAYEVCYRCTGILPAAFLAVAILAYPGALSRKVIGLFLGVPVLISLNLARLMHLYYVGVHNPAAFDLAHGYLWECLLILATFGIWFGWMRWAKEGKTCLLQGRWFLYILKLSKHPGPH
jgi:archaeosortase B (VPXXXP-CTERM-specific)